MHGYALKKLVEDFKHDKPDYRKQAAKGFKEALGLKQLNAQEFSARELFIECFGYAEMQEFVGNAGYSFGQLKEVAGAISTGAFLNISNQFMASTFMDAYEVPEMYFAKLIPTVKTNRRWERVGGVSQIGDEAQVVAEGKNYPLVGPSEDWRNTPEVEKRGIAAAITKETILFDETGLVVERVRQIGEWLGVNHEKRAIDCIVDENTTKHRYRWKDTTYASYVDTPWDNLLASTPLVDYRSFDTARQQLGGILDPFTGERQGAVIRDLIVPPSLQITAGFALGGELRHSPGGYAASGVVTQSTMANPIGGVLNGMPRIHSSFLMLDRTATDTNWYLGDIAAYAEYREVWKITLDQIGSGTQADFDRDIVQQWKASSMGAFGVKNPRKMLKVTA